MRSPAVSFLFACLLLLLAPSCSSTTDSSTSTDANPAAGSLEWLEAAPDLANRMDQRMEQMPWINGVEEQVEMIQWWAERGEPAYSRLLKMAADPRPAVADLALAALATSRDGRLVEPLRTIPWPAEEQVDLRYSRARAHLRLGDWSYVGELVNGLEDERLFARAMCFKILRGATKQDLGYDPHAPQEERAVAVESWRTWQQSREADVMLGAQE